jgi:hypothetical protein
MRALLGGAGSCHPAPMGLSLAEGGKARQPSQWFALSTTDLGDTLQRRAIQGSRAIPFAATSLLALAMSMPAR